MNARTPLPRVNIYGLSSNFEIIVGSICMGIAMYILYNNYTNVDADVGRNNMFLMINTIAGLFLLKGGIRRFKMMKKFNRYADILDKDPNYSLANLAQAVNLPVATIVAEFESIIRMKILKEARVDKQDQRLVLSGWTAAGPPSSKKLNMVDVDCANCGSSNKVEEGFMGQCKSCGRTIIDE